MQYFETAFPKEPSPLIQQCLILDLISESYRLEIKAVPPKNCQAELVEAGLVKIMAFDKFRLTEKY